MTLGEEYQEIRGLWLDNMMAETLKSHIAKLDLGEWSD
jgi:hypothetical protein